MLAMSRAMAHASLPDPGIQSRISEERSRLEAVLDQGLIRLPGNEAKRKSSPAVSVVLGTMHLEHRFSSLSADAPYVSVERITRQDEPDLIIVHSNQSHPAAATKDLGRWACHALAEAAALEVFGSVGFLEAKGKILAALLEQAPLRRALARSYTATT